METETSEISWLEWAKKYEKELGGQVIACEDIINGELFICGSIQLLAIFRVTLINGAVKALLLDNSGIVVEDWQELFDRTPAYKIDNGWTFFPDVGEEVEVIGREGPWKINEIFDKDIFEPTLFEIEQGQEVHYEEFEKIKNLPVWQKRA